ncbi:MAG: hypothetical protein ACK514_16535 [Bacteroidota bacterium]|jgi:hypothetical protein
MGKIIILSVIRKRFLVLACLVFMIPQVTSILRGQEAAGYTHLHMSAKSLLKYKFVFRNDSLFMQGLILERKSNLPILNMNISIMADRIGTMPDCSGNFTLYLKSGNGVIRFDKTQFDKFDFQYNSKAIR